MRQLRFTPAHYRLFQEEKLTLTLEKKNAQSKRVLPLKTCPGDRPQAKFYYKNIYTHSFRVKQTNWENHYVLNVV